MRKDNVICDYCGAVMDVVETTEAIDCEFGETIYFNCPNCGTLFECTEPSADRTADFEFYADEKIINERLPQYSHCTNCGHSIGSSGNLMLSDFDDSVSDDDDRTGLYMCACPHCGIKETRWYPSEKENNNRKQYAGGDITDRT